jgi:hypothetical protein
MPETDKAKREFRTITIGKGKDKRVLRVAIVRKRKRGNHGTKQG